MLIQKQIDMPVIRPGFAAVAPLPDTAFVWSIACSIPPLTYHTSLLAYFLDMWSDSYTADNGV